MIDFQIGHFVNAVVYALLGIVIFAASFAFVDWLTPYDLWKEICEDKNMALAIMVGATALGMCIIIAAAVH
jgi:putative membrane protein